MVVTMDINSNHENTSFLIKYNPDYGEGCGKFLATFLTLDPNIDLDMALKLRPFGGFTDMDNSMLDKYFKSLEILRIQAILHDAQVFVFDLSEKGRGYVLPVH